MFARWFVGCCIFLVLTSVFISASSSGLDLLLRRVAGATAAFLSHDTSNLGLSATRALVVAKTFDAKSQFTYRERGSSFQEITRKLGIQYNQRWRGRDLQRVWLKYPSTF